MDVPVTNGFIHIVDAVMFPPSETIYQLVQNNPDFSTLSNAIDTAGIVDIINNMFVNIHFNIGFIHLLAMATQN